LENVGTFRPCLDFFYQSMPPRGFSGTPNCQNYRNSFAPWFSAYNLTAENNDKREMTSRADGNIPFLNGPMDQNVKSQAVQQDYKNFTRGHLNPNLHHKEQQDSEATFTLTNMVPQLDFLYCSSPDGRISTTGPAYISTGIIPYKTERWIENRVAVPEYLWSAYCCPDYSSKESNKFPTFAAIGRNDNKSTIPVDKSKKGYYMRSIWRSISHRDLGQRSGC
uniref:Uncharacterized protein n=1 Tax=Denticeps clupeoides TaxID=299321 RepID=A0AAY3ZTR6_9TELE